MRALPLLVLSLANRTLVIASSKATKQSGRSGPARAAVKHLIKQASWFKGEDGRRHICQYDIPHSEGENGGREAAFFMCAGGWKRPQGFWPFARKSDIRPAERSAESSRDFAVR
jgi:hypothetical protein